MAPRRIPLVREVTSKIGKPVGRRQISKEVRDLIVQMVSENPGWGSFPHPWRTSQCSVLMFPRKNNFSLDETFPSGTLTQPGAGSPFFATTGKPSLRWISSRFPRSPSVYSTASFVIAHDRRRILLRNVTKHPTSLWIVQQLREAFPFKRLLSSTFPTTTRGARILDSGRKHQAAELTPGVVQVRRRQRQWLKAEMSPFLIEYPFVATSL